MSNTECASQLVKTGCHYVDRFVCSGLGQFKHLAEAFAHVTHLDNKALLKSPAPSFRLGLIADRHTGKTTFSNLMLATSADLPEKIVSGELEIDQHGQFYAAIDHFGHVFRTDHFVGKFKGTTIRDCPEKQAADLHIVEHARLDDALFDAVVLLPAKGMAHVFVAAAVAMSDGYQQFWKSTNILPRERLVLAR